MTTRVYLGVDVGTGSARAGAFDSKGALLGQATREIKTWRPEEDFVEQSSEDIWSACCGAVRGAMERAGVTPDQVGGVGFDATCSLVALDGDDQPVTVSPTGRDEQNVVVWMDHRAIEQAARINATEHPVLRYVGGVISPEMQSPKLLWILENLPEESWNRTAKFLDLPDFLTYRATGDATRSLCTTVCKWTYQGHEGEDDRGDSLGRWDESYWRSVGLESLAEEGFERIGTRVRPMGEALGKGLTHEAAAELGLRRGTPVGVSIIDAHAGGVGLLGARIDVGEDLAVELDQRLALIGGTSSCHMAVSKEPRFIPGVWGPYFSSMVPAWWLTEGGQSATGALVDHVIYSHSRAVELKAEALSQGTTVYELLNQRLEFLAQGVDFPALLTKELHVMPDFHGNRSPRAEPTLRGMISGMRLSDSLDELALLYFATIQAVAYGTRHIIEALNDSGYRIETILMCGGGTKNPVFLREHADATGCRIILGQEPEAVLLGSAMLGAVASGDFASLLEAMGDMSGVGEQIEPSKGSVARYHGAKYSIFHQMYKDQITYRKTMNSLSLP